MISTSAFFDSAEMTFPDKSGFSLKFTEFVLIYPILFFAPVSFNFSVLTHPSKFSEVT